MAFEENVEPGATFNLVILFRTNLRQYVLLRKAFTLKINLMLFFESLLPRDIPPSRNMQLGVSTNRNWSKHITLEFHCCVYPINYILSRFWSTKRLINSLTLSLSTVPSRRRGISNIPRALHKTFSTDRIIVYNLNCSPIFSIVIYVLVWNINI